MLNEEIRKIVMGFRPIDDDFMNIIFSENTPLVEYVIRVILNKNDLVIESSKTQVDTHHIGSRNITFDVLAKDSAGNKYNIEVQRSNSGADKKRARFHSASIDVNSLESGQSFKKLIDSYIIFITENDVLRGNNLIYHIERSITETGKKFNDGAHIIYVNASYNNIDSELGKLVHDFMCKQSNEMLCKPLAEVTYKYKNTPEGVEHMCKAVEEYGQKRENIGCQKGIISTIKKLLKKGILSNKEIAEAMDMSEESINEIASQIN